MMLYTRLLDTLREGAEVEIWAASMRNPDLRGLWDHVPGARPFPEVRPFKEFPYNYLRRLNEFTWDYRLRLPSRLSWQRFAKKRKLSIRALKLPARVLATIGAAKPLERWLEGVLQGCPRSPEAATRLRETRPDLLLATNPFWFLEPAVVAEAKRLAVPVAALVPSWDNLTTKNRMVFRYDAYLLWSDQARRELCSLYPGSDTRPLHVVGAPQFDPFFRPEFQCSREAFCAAVGLRSDRPILLYSLGSPNFVQEHHGALDMARRVCAGELGRVQLLVRPHPVHDRGEFVRAFESFGPRVAVQVPPLAGDDVRVRSQERSSVVEWINTFRHADVVVNLASTVTVDAALCDRPVVCLDYDPEPGSPNTQLVHEVNHLWSHWKPVAESGGVTLAKSPEGVVQAVRRYLVSPELHRAQRRWIVDYVCGQSDGACGERLGRAILLEARR